MGFGILHPITALGEMGLLFLMPKRHAEFLTPPDSFYTTMETQSKVNSSLECKDALNCMNTLIV